MKKIKSKPECEGNKHLYYFQNSMLFGKKLTFLIKFKHMKGTSFLTGQTELLSIIFQ